MNFRIAFAGVLWTGVLTLILVESGLTDRVNNSLLDRQFALLRAASSPAPDDDIVIVGIDEETVRRFPEPMALWHGNFAKFLSATSDGGARVVAIDIALPERSFDHILPGADKALASALLGARRNMPVVLAASIEPDGRQRPINPAFLAAAGDNAVGFAVVAPDADGVVRRFDENLGAGNSLIPTFAGQIARALGKSPRFGWIDFTDGQQFSYVPLHEVLQWSAAYDVPQLARVFAGKTVLLGSVLKFEDVHRAPLSIAAWDPDSRGMPGVLLHAQALRNILDGRLIVAAPAWAGIVICAVLMFSWLLSSNLKLLTLALFSATALVLAASTWLLTRGVYAPPAIALAPLFAGLLSRSGYETALRFRERRRLRRVFAGYVSPVVMEEIVAGRIAPELAGISRFVCVMFSDIRGYTARSASMPPPENIVFLNRYFEGVVKIIHANSGTVMRFMGDGIMVVFGAPQPSGNPCQQAFDAARQMLDHLRQFNAAARLARDHAVEIGIGLNCGEAIVGNVGAASRHEYTAIGDVTNVASRMEGLTKDIGYRLALTRATVARLSDTAGVVSLGARSIRGHAPVEVFGYEFSASSDEVCASAAAS